MSLLFDEYPLIVQPHLAVMVGLNEAIILQQLHYWLQKKSSHTRDGKQWVYNTYVEWQEQMPFLTVKQIRDAITGLEGCGIIISANYNKLTVDRTKWYTIDYQKLNAVVSITVIPTSPEKTERPCDVQVTPCDPQVTPDDVQVASVPETTTDITTEITSNNPSTLCVDAQNVQPQHDIVQEELFGDNVLGENKKKEKKGKENLLWPASKIWRDATSIKLRPAARILLEEAYTKFLDKQEFVNLVTAYNVNSVGGPQNIGWFVEWIGKGAPIGPKDNPRYLSKKTIIPRKKIKKIVKLVGVYADKDEYVEMEVYEDEQ